MTIAIGKKMPRIAVQTNDEPLTLPDDCEGMQLVVYFYSKDNTSGCTNEAKSFRDLYDEFQNANTAILGVSRDGVKSHANFAARHELPFALVSDAEEKLCALFDVIRPKKMYGREFMGVERSTFLFDAKGILRAEWRKVKVAGHAEIVLAAARELSGA